MKRRYDKIIANSIELARKQIYHIKVLIFKYLILKYYLSENYSQ